MYSSLGRQRRNKPWTEIANGKLATATEVTTQDGVASSLTCLLLLHMLLHREKARIPSSIHYDACRRHGSRIRTVPRLASERKLTVGGYSKEAPAAYYGRMVLFFRRVGHCNFRFMADPCPFRH